MANAAKRCVLILCTGNSARSQLAEGWLRTLGGERFAALSAGTAPKQAVHPLALQVMREAGVDLAGHRPKDVRRFLGQSFDCIITVCDNARDTCPTFPGAQRQLHWSLPDPAAVAEPQQEAAFRQTSAEIRQRIRRFIADQTAV